MVPTPMMQSPPGAEVMIDGRRCLYFAGTAYLGLQSHPEVVRAACEAAQRYGIGPATARIGFGNQPPVVEAEHAASTYFARADAFYMPSAYAAPGAVVAALGDSFHAIFVDEFAHYAATDAARLSGKPVVKFAHRSAGNLAVKLRETLAAGQSPLVVSDGVFPATGHVAPVPAYLDALARSPGAALLLDDAHGVGVLGANGRGTFEHHGIDSIHVNALPSTELRAGEALRTGARLYDCATLSKALGAYGGIVAGDARFVARCKSASHQYDGCNGPPAPIAAAAAAALRLLITDPTPRHRLAHNTHLLHAGLHRIGLDVEDQPTPIVALDLGDAQWMLRAQQRLLNEGVAIAFLRYPGTPDRGVLRIAVSAVHEPPMIDHLVERLRRAL